MKQVPELSFSLSLTNTHITHTTHTHTLQSILKFVTHLLQGGHWLGEDGLPIRPDEHDEDEMVHHQVND